MTPEQFRIKWGNEFASITLREIIGRLDSKTNTTLVSLGREISDDLQKLVNETMRNQQVLGYGRTVATSEADAEDINRQPRKPPG